MTISRWAAGGALIALCVGGACSDDGTGSTDAGGDAADAAAVFLKACDSDDDCAGGRCIAFGSAKRCTRSCAGSIDCPGLEPWRCETVCRCTPSSSGPSDRCGVDADCDGEADRQKRTEVCDQKDDDCNGKVDDVAANAKGAKQYYPDRDGDGYGNDAEGKWSCAQPSGWVARGLDCDDTRKSVNPGATEVCGNKRDEDCDSSTDDSDVCGLEPPIVPDVTKSSTSGRLASCKKTAGIDQSLDITEIVAKQDQSAIKFTIRLAGAAETSSCATYRTAFGSGTSTYRLVYVYRPAGALCSPLARLEVYDQGKKISTTVKPGFSAADPGHVSLIIAKSELFSRVPKPTYWMQVCSIAKADGAKDPLGCATASDSCKLPIKR